jgi:hypothetical protein
MVGPPSLVEAGINYSDLTGKDFEKASSTENSPWHRASTSYCIGPVRRDALLVEGGGKRFRAFKISQSDAPPCGFL